MYPFFQAMPQGNPFPVYQYPPPPQGRGRGRGRGSSNPERKANRGNPVNDVKGHIDYMKPGQVLETVRYAAETLRKKSPKLFADFCTGLPSAAQAAADTSGDGRAVLEIRISRYKEQVGEDGYCTELDNLRTQARDAKFNSVHDWVTSGKAPPGTGDKILIARKRKEEIARSVGLLFDSSSNLVIDPDYQVETNSNASQEAELPPAARANGSAPSSSYLHQENERLREEMSRLTAALRSQNSFPHAYNRPYPLYGPSTGPMPAQAGPMSRTAMEEVEHQYAQLTKMTDALALLRVPPARAERVVPVLLPEAEDG